MRGRKNASAASSMLRQHRKWISPAGGKARPIKLSLRRRQAIGRRVGKSGKTQSPELTGEASEDFGGPVKEEGQSGVRGLALSEAVDRIEALERRVAELEQQLAEVSRRQAEGSSDNSEWYKQCQRRLEILQSPAPAHLSFVPAVHFGADDMASREAWLEQMRFRLAVITRNR